MIKTEHESTYGLIPAPAKMLYFVRHAEGESNVSDRRLDSASPLTSGGKEQARKLAYYCASLHPDALFASPVMRAYETATYISETCNLKIRSCNLLTERRRPSELDGLRKNSEEARRIDISLRANFHLPRWRFSDEENFDDLKSRCIGILSFLEKQKGDRIVAVTHGIVVRIIVACAIHGDDLTGAECERFIRGFRMQKSGVTAFSVNHNPSDEGVASKFQLWMWNNYSHLA